MSDNEEEKQSNHFPNGKSESLFIIPNCAKNGMFV